MFALVGTGGQGKRGDEMKEPKGAWAIVEAVPVHYEEPQLFLKLWPNSRNPFGSWIPLAASNTLSDKDVVIEESHYYYRWEHLSSPRLVRKGIAA